MSEMYEFSNPEEFNQLIVEKNWPSVEVYFTFSGDPHHEYFHVYYDDKNDFFYKDDVLKNLNLSEAAHYFHEHQNAKLAYNICPQLGIVTSTELFELVWEEDSENEGLIDLHRYMVTNRVPGIYYNDFIADKRIPPELKQNVQYNIALKRLEYGLLLGHDDCHERDVTILSYAENEVSIGLIDLVGAFSEWPTNKEEIEYETENIFKEIPKDMPRQRMLDVLPMVKENLQKHKALFPKSHLPDSERRLVAVEKYIRKDKRFSSPEL